MEGIVNWWIVSCLLHKKDKSFLIAQWLVMSFQPISLNQFTTFLPSLLIQHKPFILKRLIYVIILHSSYWKAKKTNKLMNEMEFVEFDLFDWIQQMEWNSCGVWLDWLVGGLWAQQRSSTAAEVHSSVILIPLSFPLPCSLSCWCPGEEKTNANCLSLISKNVE